MSPRAKVWSCGANLLTVLAQRVLAGFPVGEDAGRWPLASWTILVPTRRAARQLQRKLFELSGQKGMVLPKIEPIGDADEDQLLSDFVEEHLPNAASKEQQLFLLLSLVDQWANSNPQLALAQDILASPTQAMGLARSLSELFLEIEAEEVELELIAYFSELDLAEHRLHVSSLLELVQERLPAELQKRELMSATARRNHLIRMKARRIAAMPDSGPVIAAGSTGTFAATRALLKVVAEHPQGAVVLPGLDQCLDDEGWAMIGPEHPQAALKLLLETLAVPRNNVLPLEEHAPLRQRLLSETFRPSVTTEQWATMPALDKQLLAGMSLVEAPDRHLEARAIAVMLREVLEVPARSAILVTPDRDLATRVTAELSRWHAEIDDSAGIPLASAGRGLLLSLLCTALEDRFSPSSLLAVLNHPLCTLGLARESFCQGFQAFELICLRQDLPLRDPHRYSAAIPALRKQWALDAHPHPTTADLTDKDWENLSDFVARLQNALAPLTHAGESPLQAHVQNLIAALDVLAPPAGAESPAGETLSQLLERLIEAADTHPPCTLHRAIVTLRWALGQETMRPFYQQQPRLAILGLAEARMVEADLVILGGLNEGAWPAGADPGPWVNRSMRTALKLKAPERDIGLTGHDFMQGLGHPRVVVTWSKRVGSDPRAPARWVLRLRAMMRLMGITESAQLSHEPVVLARAMDQAEHFAPIAAPAPKPVVALRPRRFSVTEITKLQRDPYAIYARRILGLEPLPRIGDTTDPRLRGMLFHAAIGEWLQAEDLSADQLLAAGERVFAPFFQEAEVRYFWWPRFRRLALALTQEEADLSTSVTRRLIEVRGIMLLTAAQREHHITARADRIDLLSNGTLRIIDYKTGEPPSAKQIIAGLETQLTLEAAMAACGAFSALAAAKAGQLMYIRVSGLMPPVEVSEPLAGEDLTAIAERHVAGLQRLFAAYQSADMAYRPRLAVFSEREDSDYDHLSRYAEWVEGVA